ncbi:MAG: response regulator transcription factor [Clostridia bacterium]|nr:response regulator transcription factor [Clostridia bacterium]
MNKVEYKSILIVEDNDGLRENLTSYFSVVNKVVACENLQSALQAVEKEKFDIILLDVILPDGNGLKLIEHTGETPVIILSDLGSDSNMIDGFSAGATDYIVKPASCTLIEMRMALRLLPDSKAQLSSHGLELNTAKRTAVYNKKPLELTSSEFNILTFLMQNAGTYYTASEIYEQVWNMPHLNTTTIKVHVSNLRKKMLAVSSDCAKLLIQEFGKGYAFINE